MTDKHYVFRSRFEQQLAKQLEAKKIDYRYEEEMIRYTKPITPSRYTPDFVLPNGIIIEAKGLFIASDRKKHLLVKEQYPHLDIRFVFQRANNRLSKTSKTTYADWATKNGFLWADSSIPDAWLTTTTT